MNENNYSLISDISYYNSKTKTKEDILSLHKANIFSDEKKWDKISLEDEIEGIRDNIKSRMKYFMSTMSLGVYNALNNGPGNNLEEQDEIYLFSGFTEIGTVSKIGDIIMTQDYSIPPSIFPNSVHHISLCYYTILNKINNYSAAITDGLLTNLSFINFIKNRVKLNSNFIVVSGEQNATFFDYDSSQRLKIKPSFVAYKIIPNSKKGFIYKGSLKHINDIKKIEEYNIVENIFTDKDTLLTLKAQTNKKIYTEYPISNENPCGIIYRLALPFYLDIKGNSLVIEKTNEKYYYYYINN